ncbi:dTDP-4-dehydrorhamnose 3,5-epimerase family protein [Methanolobus sp. ZRKC5]|uniref:dTDP-4-dehydrorhamnose 3,5-epimerase family protein n=1 Tax=unclassified Methanolobus TaxID=2629569 RepID=UPI00313BFD4C
MIEGVEVIPLRKIPDERGKIMHMLRVDDKHFEKFGEIYFSMAYPSVIKGWHLHTQMTLNYAVIQGMIKLVLFDQRENSETKGLLQELFIGEDNYCLVKIPPGIANGYKVYGTESAIVANCASHPHDPEEMIRIDPFSKEMPYNWDLVHK